jgi:hypothetical protein
MNFIGKSAFEGRFMAKYDSTEDTLAKIEEEVLKYRRGRRRRRILSRRGRNLAIVLAVTLLPCCCCCGILYNSWENVPVKVLAWFTKYPGAKKIEADSYAPGSAPLFYQWIIYWTEDSVSDVIDHYEKVFPQFEQTGAPSGSRVEDYPVTFRSYYDPLDMAILVLDADQANRRVAYDPHFWVSVPADAPRTGTLIVIMYYSVALID